jgi:hypothetical protein
VALALVVVVAAGAGPARAADRGRDANEHLREIVDRSVAPQFRRMGSPGMAQVADYAAGVLASSGYEVRRHEVPTTAWEIDYSEADAPLLERTSDGHKFLADAAYYAANAEVTCTVRLVADITPGDCGLVPFQTVSPEWKNPFVGAAAAVDAMLAKGAIGIVLQGDVARQATIAVRVNRPVPVVVSPVADADVVGQSVRLRSHGRTIPATMHNVIGVRPPADPANGYLLLQGHMDGFYEAAVDNGGGAAAVLAAAEQLGGEDRERGLIVALYDGEEWGLLGSKAVAADLTSADGLRIGPCTPDLHMGDIAAVVNLDAPSARASDADGIVERQTGFEVPLFSWRAMVYSEEPVLPPVFLTTMAANAVLGAPISVQAANPVNGGVSRTDAKWFDDAGLAVVWPVTGYPEYHTSADTLAAVDPADLSAVAAGTVALVRAADTIPVQRHAALAEPGTSGETVDDAACAAVTPTVPEAPGTPVAMMALIVLTGGVVVRRRWRTIHPNG